MRAETSTLGLRTGLRWWTGLSTMLTKENAAWWRTRRWWVVSLLWLVVINGTVGLNVRFGAGGALGAMVGMLALAVPMAAIAIGPDSFFRERHSGTAAWVLTKPMGRPAFVLAKVSAHAVGFLATSVIVPGVLAYVQIVVFGKAQLVLAGYAALLGLAFLVLLFYVTLTVMLATLFRNRGPVLGIAFGWLYGPLAAGELLAKHLPWLTDIMPWQLLMPVGSAPPLVGYLLGGQPLPTVLPIVATALWCVAFVLVAVWRFGREEM